ncbi:Ribosomal L1 domain-containing protein 1 [Desmophyllum pertusum]|uniref:Ribosomal L1 domain-containing protein 1 n=1 Tax=Desmophyllum pertusum TaxID=174260 RepID=A0A9W9YHZ2_9CNID|nr:Ribosomal L1 domain-containing protein 1 [Desmophyllum pertusum]
MADSRSKAVRESQLDRKQVELAVPALVKFVGEKKGKQLRLLNEHETILLILALKKIPNPDKKPKKIPLPHSLHSDNVEVCLFAKEDSTKTKEMLKSKEVTVKKVISLAKLRKNYQSFEAKRQLCSLYDVFICDDTIYHLLPKLLGKAFFSRKKFPVPVDLKKTNLKKEMDKVLQCSLMTLGHGPCSAIKVAHTGQTIEQAVENVVSAVSEIARIVPRGWNNIQSLNLKTSDSISLPIYTSLPEKSLAIENSQPPNKKRKMKT